MKVFLPLMLAGAMHASGQTTGYVNLLRQQQQGTGVVWDMPVAATGSSLSALALENGGSLFQLWTIKSGTATDYLLDQKLVGAYLPTADIVVTTLDPNGKVPRTRVDQPFSVDININGLLTGSDFPLASANVLLERHLANYPTDGFVLDPSKVISGTPASSAYLSQNGKNPLRFAASSLTAADPTKATGEEHFVVHALADGTSTQTQIASAMVQVWPVASGEIKGIANGDRLRFQSPKIELIINDLYPRSDTYLMLYEGTQYTGTTGQIVMAYPMDRDTSESTVIAVDDLDAKVTKDGTYTLALFSDTVYGRELLCETVTFQVNRTIQVNAMQVGFSDGQDP